MAIAASPESASHRPAPATPPLKGRRVLLIEDDDQAAAYTASELQDHDWAVERAIDGVEGLRLAADARFDVIIVDRMLPALDGLSLVARLRSLGVDTPVLFATAMGAVDDRIAGLEQGGDDYLVKPFSFAELRARLNVLARRRDAAQIDKTVLRVRHVSLDRLQRSVTAGGRPVDLLPLEYKLLEYLMQHTDQVVTRLMLLQQVWGFKFDPQTNIVETHISRLRAKIDSKDAEPLIKTVRGAGYLIANA